MKRYTSVYVRNIFSIRNGALSTGWCAGGGWYCNSIYYDGASGRGLIFFTAVWSYVHQGWFFQTDWYRRSRGWKWYLVAGLVSGGAVFTLFFGTTVVTAVPWWQLLVAGVLVGVGTRMSGGCTSGHGVRGLASLEKVSLVATGTFLTTAIVVALLTSKILVW